jgi:two-component system nitrogen regulation sensor histidine kinase GlnL
MITDNLTASILDNLTTIALLFDGELRLRYINPAGEMLFALSARTLLGRHADELLPCPKGLPSVHFAAALENGQGFTERGMVLNLVAQEVTVDCTVIPIQDRLGQRHIVVEIQHVDRQLRISKEENLIAQQKTASSVLRNLAHEIKNPLGGLRGAAQLLQDELGDPEQREYTQVIIAEADRLQGLVNRLLGPNKVPSFIQVNIHQLLERVRRLILAESAHSIELIRDYDPSIPEFRAEPDLLIQAILNIARNAARAVDDEGEILLRTRIQRQFTIGITRHRLVLQIDICDNGPGIPKELLDKIFFPMVSGSEGGAGLGLSIAQSLINQHGGLIECSSKPGETSFTILLPLETADE